MTKMIQDYRKLRQNQKEYSLNIPKQMVEYLLWQKKDKIHCIIRDDGDSIVLSCFERQQQLKTKREEEQRQKQIQQKQNELVELQSQEVNTGNPYDFEP